MPTNWQGCYVHTSFSASHLQHPEMQPVTGTVTPPLFPVGGHVTKQHDARGIQFTCRRPMPAPRSAAAQDCLVRAGTPHLAHSVAWCPPHSPRASCVQSQSFAHPHVVATACRPLQTPRQSLLYCWSDWPRRLRARKKMAKSLRRSQAARMNKNGMSSGAQRHGAAQVVAA